MSIARVIQGRTHRTVTVHPETTVRDAAAALAEKRIGAVPVIENGRVVGIFSERDVIYRLRDHGAALLDMRVDAVMTPNPITVDPQTPVLDALELMTERRIRHLPVVEGEVLVSFISIGDLVKYRIERIQSEAEQLRDYITTA